MAWGAVELEPEVADWLERLSDEEFGRVEFYVDLLAERGPLLEYPTRANSEASSARLRFYLGSRGDAVRISYYIASRRRIILLTVFTKQKRRERGEIDRAEQAMKRCIQDGHTGEDGGNG